jgi:hypothetical protein
MFIKKSIFRMFFVLLVVLLMSGSTLARPLEAPLGTGFTYQGKLSDDGVPANGTYDFEFKLYDDLSVGEQVGSTITLGDVLVTGGLFTVQLDFGKSFDGTALYLDIAVRAGASTGTYTALTPRQALTPTPYAIFASKAPWSGLTGVPGGFADGVDNNTTYTAGDGLELDGTQFKGKGTSYQNVVIVAQSGGDFTTITAALDSITDASDTNRYLIYVAPGVYNERVTMKEYVDIEGSGELTTKITFTGSSANTNGTLRGANNAELRFLTVENTGGNAYANAIHNNNASPRLTHVTAIASGGTNASYGVYNTSSSSPIMTEVAASASEGSTSYGVYNNSSSPTMMNVSARALWGMNNFGLYNNNSSPTMTNVTASASGGTETYGVYNYSSSSPTMTNVNASTSGGTNANYGVCNYSSSSPTMTNVNASASGGTNNYGVFNHSSSSPTMTNVNTSASGGTNNYGVVNSISSPIMTNVTSSASGGTNYNYGVYNSSSSATINNSVINASSVGINNVAGGGTYTVLVNNSQISGSINTIHSDSEFTTLVGASQLSGGAVSSGGGTVTCIGVYDENYASPGYTTCP